jgi:hypothetical protein
MTMLRPSITPIATLFFAGCLGSAPPPGSATAPPAATGPSDPALGGQPLGTAGGVGNTYNHENNDPDPFEILQRLEQTGAPDVSTRMHSCQKIKYATLGNLLVSRGVNLTKTGTPPTAGQLYTAGGQAMGAPNYLARVAEAKTATTASATKLFDIFVQAAPEIIAAMPTLAACKKAGVGTAMFDAQGQCSLDGISCLQGAPATPAQRDVCNAALAQGSTPAIGQTIAVATILAAAHTCE